MQLATKAHLGKVYMVAAGGCSITFAGSLIGAYYPPYNTPIDHPRAAADHRVDDQAND